MMENFSSIDRPCLEAILGEWEKDFGYDEMRDLLARFAHKVEMSDEAWDLYHSVMVAY
jgi:hypothetical protein